MSLAYVCVGDNENDTPLRQKILFSFSIIKFIVD